MIKICVSGSEGKMGSRIIELAKVDPELEVAAGFDVNGNAELGITACECLIDFTSPEAAMEHLTLCEKLKKPIVIGTTGLSEEDKDKIKKTADQIPIVISANMSVGVNLLFKLIAEASKVLGEDYEVNIVEAHHAEKKDAPSGTAKEIAKIIKGVKGVCGNGPGIGGNLRQPCLLLGGEMDFHRPQGNRSRRSLQDVHSTPQHACATTAPLSPVPPLFHDDIHELPWHHDHLHHRFAGDGSLGVRSKDKNTDDNKISCEFHSGFFLVVHAVSSNKKIVAKPNGN